MQRTQNIKNVNNTEESPIVLSLCTGIRGLERGIERALGVPLRVACYVEIEAFIMENLLASIESSLVAPSLIWANLKTFPFAQFAGKVHGIIGGYPCTPFSLAGLRKGEDDPRHLWPFICAGINAARPVWCFFENVDDHLTMGFDQVYRDLRAMGYLVEIGISSAEEAGAPHERQRLYILAVRQEMAYTDGYDPGRIFGHVLRTQGKGLGEKDQRQRNWDEPGACGEAMANTGSIGIRESGGIEQSELIEPDGVQGRDEELENTGGSGGHGRSKGHSGRSGCECDVEGPGCELGDTEGIGRAGHGDVAGSDSQTDGKVQWRGFKRTDTAFGGWPAGQGEYQHPWEPARTIESGMEYSINGYNFTGDLHRAIGNSVVEQTAESAFINLIHKHIKTANYGKR